MDLDQHELISFAVFIYCRCIGYLGLDNMEIGFTDLIYLAQLCKTTNIVRNFFVQHVCNEQSLFLELGNNIPSCHIMYYDYLQNSDLSYSTYLQMRQHIRQHKLGLFATIKTNKCSKLKLLRTKIFLNWANGEQIYINDKQHVVLFSKNKSLTV